MSPFVSGVLAVLWAFWCLAWDVIGLVVAIPTVEGPAGVFVLGLIASCVVILEFASVLAILGWGGEP